MVGRRGPSQEEEGKGNCLMNRRVRVGKRRTIVSRSWKSCIKTCSLNGVMKREDEMELGPCHIGKIEEIHIHRPYHS